MSDFRGMEAYRLRQLNDAFARFARMCDCGADKALDARGVLLETCTSCASRDKVAMSMANATPQRR